MGAELLGAQSFLKAFSASKPFLEAAAMAIELARAERIAARARALAPLGNENDPHAGRLVEDIGIKNQGIERAGPFIEVGTTMPEGFLQEYGTFDEHPQPFMRPAIAEETL